MRDCDACGKPTDLIVYDVDGQELCPDCGADANDDQIKARIARLESLLFDLTTVVRGMDHGEVWEPELKAIRAELVEIIPKSA